MQSRPNRPPLAAGTGLVSSHRIKAQILSPSTSTCTEAGGPISRPPGSFAHSPPGMLGPPPSANPLTGRYGLSAGAWAKHETSAASTAMPHNAIHPIRLAFDMAHLSSGKVKSGRVGKAKRAHRNTGIVAVGTLRFAHPTFVIPVERISLSRRALLNATAPSRSGAAT